MTQDVSFSIGTKRVGRNHEHLKLVVVHDTNPLKDRSGIGFGMGYLCDKVHAASYFDLCYTLQENEFMGKNDIQMMIKDIHFKGEDED